MSSHAVSHALLRGATLVAVLLLNPPRPAAAPVVNEFVALPAGGEGEWIEILNPGAAPVDLGGWVVRDGTGRDRAVPAGTAIAPGGFLLLADRPDSLRLAFAVPESVLVVRPSGWPALNDHDAAAGLPADVVVLARPDGSVADSLAYFESWLPPERGRSVERVSPDAPSTEAGSWGWSVDPGGATPGRPNALAAIAPGRGALRGPREVAPRRRPSVFTFSLPGPGILALWLLDRDGRTLAVLREAGPVAAAGAWVWGSDAPLPPRSGPCLLCLTWQPGDGAGAPVRACRSVWVER